MAIVLAVDDNHTNLRLIEAMLRALPEVESVMLDDPVLALDWCAENRPDLILLDYMMPELDGLEFMRRLKRTTDCPVIMITADTERQVRYQALELGARDFLNKPLDRAEFIARVRNQLALIDAQRKLADRAAWLAEEVDKATALIRSREHETVLRLSRAAEYRDPETGAHLLRMAHYSRLIAIQLGLSRAEAELLFQAAPMHDVGKVGIPDAILLKPGRLDEAEFAVMKRHAEIGRDILAGSTADLLCLAAEIAWSHHEKWDGSGYPRALAGEAIPRAGRIVAVADVFDALTSERPYKRAWPLERARQFLIEQRGAHFDPACVDAFLAVWDDALAIHDRYRDSLT
ncbi:two-component system response regulator [Zoogloeaceae bacteirum Par-f-2]|nr:two-component system response regulator [Zoogloeaceae bacteirum Par-f-2]